MACGVEQIPTIRQHNSGFCFLVGKPTTQNRLNLFWNTYLLFHRAKYQKLSFLLLVKSCFNKSSELWRHLRLVVLLDSGIFFTLETAFFLRGNGFFSSIDNDVLEMLQRMLWFILMSRMLWPHKFLRCPGAELLLPNKIGNALKDAVSAFLL